MKGDEFGYDYHQQRHAELVQEADHARLIKYLEAVNRAEQGRLSLAQRVQAATGSVLASVGSRLQQAAAQSLPRAPMAVGIIKD